MTLLHLCDKKTALCEKLSFSVGFFYNLHLDIGCVIFSLVYEIPRNIFHILE
jgi:hypothetical protein